MATSGMVSMILSYRTTEADGLATVTTDCEWLSEKSHDLETHHARSGVVVFTGSTHTVDLAAICPAATNIASIGLRVSGGDIAVHLPGWFDAAVQSGGAVCYAAGDDGQPCTVLTLAKTGNAEITVEYAIIFLE